MSKYIKDILSDPAIVMLSLITVVTIIDTLENIA